MSEIQLSTGGQVAEAEEASRRPLRTIFMGTPDFACAPLKALYFHPDVELLALVSQADKAQGRHQELRPTATKQLAETWGLPVYQPRALRDGQFYQDMAALEPELIITCAYGRIVPQEVLDLPRCGAYNLHASLLPKYRGASPMQWALINGDAETGVTVIQMDSEMDHGPIFAQRKLKIEADMHLPELSKMLSYLAAELAQDFVTALAGGYAEGQEQEHEQASYVSLLKREDGELDWSRPARELYNQLRGMDPWPGVHSGYKGRKLKIYQARPLHLSELPDLPSEQEAWPAGSLLRPQGCKRRLLVRCAEDTVLELLEIQLEGAKRLLAQELAHNFIPGTVLAL